MKNKYYVRNWDRPIGLEPKIFSSYEEANIPNNNNDNPFGCEVEVYKSKKEAERRIKEYE